MKGKALGLTGLLKLTRDVKRQTTLKQTAITQRVAKKDAGSSKNQKPFKTWSSPEAKQKAEIRNAKSLQLSTASTRLLARRGRRTKVIQRLEKAGRTTEAAHLKKAPIRDMSHLKGSMTMTQAQKKLKK